MMIAKVKTMQLVDRMADAIGNLIELCRLQNQRIEMLERTFADLCGDDEVLPFRDDQGGDLRSKYEMILRDLIES